MSQPKNWWLGLVPLILLWIFANVYKTDSVETELQARSLASAATGSGNLIDKPNVAVAGRDVTISGVAFTPDAQKSAVAAVDDANGVRLVKSQIEPLPVQKPYGFAATRDGDRIVLTGNAPLPAVRAKIVEQARAAWPGVNVVDQMVYAAGAPAGFEGSIAYGLGIASKLGNGIFSMSDQALSLAGAAATSEVYENALAALKQLPSGATLSKADILPPEAKPYVWGAASDGKSITLSGNATSLDIRDTIGAKAAAIFGSAAAGKLDIARGAPNGDFAALANFALTELGKLTDGKASLVDDVLTISGNGKANVSAATIEADAKSGLPQGFKLGKLEIVEGVISPYGFTASKQDGSLVLSGHIPDDKVRADLLDVVTRKYFDTKVDDRLAIGKGAPDGFGAAASALVNGMARLAAGTASLSDTKVSIKGDAFYQKAIDQILAAIKAALPAGYQQEALGLTVKDAGPPLEATACQPVFTGVLGKGKILFETGSTRIDADSAAVLDNLVSIANRCSNSSIEIGGHTDSVGSDESNMSLSKRRADSVQAYLTEAGVDPARLTTEGYGKNKPIAPNDTDEGRAQNRRIEFLVK